MTPAAGRASAAPFKGITYRGGGLFSLVKIRGRDDTPDDFFPTAQAAADAYDALMRERGCLVVNTPLFAGELKAVRRESAQDTMRRAAEETEQQQQHEQQQKRRMTDGATAGGGTGGAGNTRIGATPLFKKPKPPSSVPSPPGVDAPIVAAAPLGVPVPQMPPPPARQSSPPVLASPPCDLILPASMAPAAAKRPAHDAAEGAPPSKRARTAADSAASRDASPNGSISANKACSADAPPAPSAVAPPANLPLVPVPMPLAAPAAPAHDLAAFLRRITPPLLDIDAAVATAEHDRSLTLSALRDSLRGPPDHALMALNLACELLGLQCDGDKLALLQALQGAAPASGLQVPSPDAADELAAFLRGIAPPLVGIEAVMDAAADSGLTVAALRRAARQGGPHAALCVRLIFTMLRVTRGGDKLTLQRALMPA
jgi:hypothetical protein